MTEPSQGALAVQQNKTHPQENAQNGAWRLLDTGACHPYYNMALDEALLQLSGETPLLRFYGWDPPALSLGYFQNASGFDLEELRARGFVLLRRPTGGGAICHWGEFTFSVITGPRHGLALGSTIEERYERVHGAVIGALQNLGVRSQLRGGELASPFSGSEDKFCFNRIIGCDIVAGGKKLAGSAQKKTPQGFLQHGSVPLLQNPMTPQASWVNELSREEVTYEVFARALADAFEESLGVSLLPSRPTEDEESAARRLVKEKYSTDSWNFKR